MHWPLRTAEGVMIVDMDEGPAVPLGLARALEAARV